MVEGEGKCKIGNFSKKKSKAQIELEKLACSINYDRPNNDGQNGVKLFGL